MTTRPHVREAYVLGALGHMAGMVEGYGYLGGSLHSFCVNGREFTVLARDSEDLRGQFMLQMIAKDKFP